MSDYMCGRNGYVSGFYHGEEGLNTLFKDGSARWVVDDRIYAHLYSVKDNNSFGTTWNAIEVCWEYLGEAF